MFTALLKRTVLAVFVGIAVGLGVGATGFGQVGSVTDSPLRAVGADAGSRQSSAPDAKTSYYANILPAQPGDNNTDRVDALPGYQFATVRVLISVAPAVFAGLEDMSGRGTSSALGALRHLNAHVTVRPLDKAGQVIESKSGGPVVLSTLEISPSEPTYSDAVGNKQQLAQTAITQAESAAKALPGIGVVQSFLSAYHRPPTTTQVAYMTGANSFGWRWYESPGAAIEGLHNGTVLFQASDDVKALKIVIDLVADWRAFGAWSKSFEFTYTLNRPPG